MIHVHFVPFDYTFHFRVGPVANEMEISSLLILFAFGLSCRNAPWCAYTLLPQLSPVRTREKCHVLVVYRITSNQFEREIQMLQIEVYAVRPSVRSFVRSFDSHTRNVNAFNCPHWLFITHIFPLSIVKMH